MTSRLLPRRKASRSLAECLMSQFGGREAGPVKYRHLVFLPLRCAALQTLAAEQEEEHRILLQPAAALILSAQFFDAACLPPLAQKCHGSQSSFGQAHPDLLV